MSTKIMAIHDKLITLLQKMAEHEIILPVLGDVIEGQLREKNIEISTFKLNSAPFGVEYDMDKNKIYINGAQVESILQSSMVDRFLKYIQNKANILSDTKYIASLAKSNLGVLIGCLLYYGTHAFNKNQRGQLVNYVDTKKWYLDFLYRSIYFFENNQLTTISRLAAVKLYYPYMWLIFEQFEVPMYNNVYFSESTIKKILGIFSNYNSKEVLPHLIRINLDQPTLDVYSDWFEAFLDAVKIFFYNQNKRRAYIDQDMLDDEDITGVSIQALNSAYNTINTTDITKYRYPAPIFRELFVTSEPLAQSIFATYLDGKISGYEEWQKISARGLSLLG